MATNVGTVDRALRAIIGTALAITGWLGVAGFTGTIIAIVGLIICATSLFSICPLYKAMGIDTRESPDPRGH